MNNLRMNAHYYGFNKTNVFPIDKILSEVATAGKMYHHTENWSDGTNSPVEKIQSAAIDAAKEITALKKELESRNEIIKELIRIDAEVIVIVAKNYIRAKWFGDRNKAIETAKKMVGEG